jgi:carbon storage regulator
MCAYASRSAPPAAATEGGNIVLVLTRRANQSIMIGHEIVVTVLEVRGDQVRLGIKAPRSIDVHREEIFAQLQQANRDAAQAPKQSIETLPDFAKPSDPDAPPKTPESNG